MMTECFSGIRLGFLSLIELHMESMHSAIVQVKENGFENAWKYNKTFILADQRTYWLNIHFTPHFS